jgi:hypothetical protein
MDILSSSTIAFAIVGGTCFFENGEIKASLGGKVGLDMVATFLC